MAAWKMLYFSARSRMGWNIRWTYWMNATTTPASSVPCRIMLPPRHRMRPTVTALLTSTRGKKSAL